MSTYFDAHSHISFSDFADDREAVLARMQEAAVSTITVGVDLESSQQAVAFAASVPRIPQEGASQIYASIGLHPRDRQDEVFDPTAFAELVRAPQVVAIGECGLDYYRIDVTSAERKRQHEACEAQLAFAVEHHKPLMIHCRDAHEEMIDLLRARKREYGEQLWGNIHFFTADTDTARAYLDLDFTLSFPGVITFARDYDDAVRLAPLNMLLVETDAPYAAPIPHRGRRNEPIHVREVVATLAELRGEPRETVRRATVENTHRVFRISQHT